MSNRIKRSVHELKDVNLSSFMNLMIVLIPILLAAAEFTKMATVDISIPDAIGSGGGIGEREEAQRLKLTVMIADSTLTIGSQTGLLPSVWYKEYHQYSGSDSLIAFDQSDGESIHEESRIDIHLIAMRDSSLSNPLMGLYSDNGELITTKNGTIVTEIAEGETYYAVQSWKSFVIDDSKAGEESTAELLSRRLVTLTSDKCTIEPVYAYDLVKSSLIAIRERGSSAPDRDDLVVASKEGIVYDKIIQFMDVGRSSNFTNVSIAKLKTN